MSDGWSRWSWRTGWKASRGEAQRVCFPPGIDMYALDDASRRIVARDVPATPGHPD